MLPSIGNIVFISVVFVLLFGSGTGLLGDGDTGYHIKTGELILQTWHIPARDPYSFHSPPLKWTAHEWLSEVFMALIFRPFGLTGVVIFFAFLLAITHWLVYRALRSKSDDILLCTLITLLATATSSTHWLARPHVFSLLLTVVWCHCLDRFQYRGQNTLIYLPLLMLLWVNLHGGFIIGLVLLTAYLFGNGFYSLTEPPERSRERRGKAKRLLFALLVSIGVCVINPYGYEILLFPFRVTSDRFVMDRVTEFLSPNFHEVLPFKYMLLSVIAALALSRSPLNVIDLMLVLLLSYMSLYSARNVSLFAIVLAPVLLKTTEGVIARAPDFFLKLYRTRNRNLTAIDDSLNGYQWPILSVILIAALAWSGGIHYQFSDKKFPIAAVEFLRRESIAGNVFNNDEFGDYMIFAVWPAYRVFMDGRSDMYSEKFGADYLTVANVLPGWKQILKKYNISWIIFDTESALTGALRDDVTWQSVYSDSVATVFVKKESINASLLAKYPPVALPLEK